ncbi:hypothetical protein BGZ51_007667, partial [Haplosporangium sp. Z 767]
ASGLVNKSDLYTKYLAIASDAASSEDLGAKAIEKQMQELWTRNIVSAAKDPSKLQKAVGRHQFHQVLMELQQEQEQEQEHQQQGQQQQKENDVFCAACTLIPSDPSDDDYSHKSSTRTSFGSTVPFEGKSNIDGPGEPSCKLHGDV